MGIRNVLAACNVETGKLSPEARMTLVVMAALSYDDAHEGHEPRVYYGGWKIAMMRQGYWPDEKGKRRFIRHVAELRERGIVELARPAARGRNAEYRLRLLVDNSVLSGDNFE